MHADRQGYLTAASDAKPDVISIGDALDGLCTCPLTLIRCGQHAAGRLAPAIGRWRTCRNRYHGNKLSFLSTLAPHVPHTCQNDAHDFRVVQNGSGPRIEDELKSCVAKLSEPFPRVGILIVIQDDKLYSQTQGRDLHRLRRWQRSPSRGARRV